MRILRRVLEIGILAALAYGVWRIVESRRTAGDATAAWEAQPFPYPPMPSGHVHVPEVVTPGGGPETDATASEEAWIEPVDGTCPTSHPVKGKLSSGIYHLPEGRMYERTRPDRCYCDAAAAEADGLRASKV